MERGDEKDNKRHPEMGYIARLHLTETVKQETSQIKPHCGITFRWIALHLPVEYKRVMMQTECVKTENRKDKVPQREELKKIYNLKKGIEYHKTEES